MPELILRKLQLSDEASFNVAVEEFREHEPEWTFAFYYEEFETFADYLAETRLWPIGEGFAAQFVPNTFLVGVVDGQVVGRVSIRHHLNEFLVRTGGHMGYSVIPSQRRRGYATQMVQAALPVLRQHDIKRALVTCDDDNVGSRTIIENHGGVFQDMVEDETLRVPVRRYLIEL